MDTKYPLFEFNNRFRYGFKQLLEFENSEPVKKQKCRTSTILLTVFILYSLSAALLSGSTNSHSRITYISVSVFLLTMIILLRTFKKHTDLCILGSFGISTLLFFHMITEVDWTIGMDAFWLFILILPFITNYIGGVIYGSISALSGFLLAILLFCTPLNLYLQPYGTSMVTWFPVIYLVVMIAAAVMEYEFTSYQIEKKSSDEKISLLEKERTKRLQEQLSIYESNELTIRKYKHDIRHFNRVLAGFINDKEYDKALEYLREFDSMLENVTAVSFCENRIVNELLTIYSARCQKEGYRLRAKADIPEKFPIQDIELTSLVANALENAFEAQQKVPEEKRFIQIEVTYDGRRLKLMTKNAFEGEIFFSESGLPASTKDTPSGIGTTQIRSIAEKYSGVANFAIEGDAFVLKAVLTCM
ncbi:MAG: sensor histidine kinase [Butyrivibrio sp.]|nr:sensor histidine kinase [Butyrivibrio sp.]